LPNKLLANFDLSVRVARYELDSTPRNESVDRSFNDRYLGDVEEPPRELADVMSKIADYYRKVAESRTTHRPVWRKPRL
jgi:hypothetical protein